MPVREATDLVGRLRSETRVPIAAIVANRVLPELFGRGEQERFDALRQSDGVGALTEALRERDAAVDRESVAEVLDAAALAVTLRRSKAEHFEELRTGIGPDLPILFVPELFARSHGARATAQIAAALADEVGG
jgi:hypothetical protein